MSTANVSSHRKCTRTHQSALSHFDEEARKPRLSPKDQTIGEEGRRTDGRRRRIRRDGEKKAGGQEEAGREKERLEGDDKNKSKVKGERNAAWWQQLLCCTDTAVTTPASDRIQTKFDAEEKVQAFKLDSASTDEKQPVHERSNRRRQKCKPKRNNITCECPRNNTNDRGRPTGTSDGSFARYPGFHDSSEDEGNRIPRPPQTEKEKKRRSNRRLSTYEERTSATVQKSEVFCDLCSHFKDQTKAEKRCRHDTRVRQGLEKKGEGRLLKNENQSEKNNINIILQLPSKMFNTCCRSSKYLSVVPRCHSNLTQDELDYIKLCVSVEEAIAKPLPCSSNRTIYDYWLNKYGIALKGLLLPDSSDLETTDEEEPQVKDRITKVKEEKVHSYIDKDKESRRVYSEKKEKRPPSGKIRTNEGKKTEVTPKKSEEDDSSKTKRDAKQSLILIRQNVSQISICPESERDEKYEGGQEELQKSKNVKEETEPEVTIQDHLVSSFLRSVTCYLDRSTHEKGQKQTPECTECLKRSNATPNNIVCESPASTRDTSTQTTEQLQDEKLQEMKGEAPLTSSPSTTSGESDITTRLLQLLESQMSRRLSRQPSSEDNGKRRRGLSTKNSVEKVSIGTQANMKTAKSFTAMCLSSESISSGSESIEMFTDQIQHISDKEKFIKGSPVLSKAGQTNAETFKATLTEEDSEDQPIRQRKRKRLDETERQGQFKLSDDVAVSETQNMISENDVQTVMAQSSRPRNASDEIPQKPKRLIDTMPPPVLSSRGFLGSSINQKDKAFNISQAESLEVLKPIQAPIPPVPSGTLPPHPDFLAPQLPPLTVPSHNLPVDAGNQCNSMKRPGPPSNNITEGLVANDHQRHRQLTPVEAPGSNECNNISTEGKSLLAVGVLPSRRSLQLAPLSPLVGSATSMRSLHPVSDLGQASRIGQLAPLADLQEDEGPKKNNGKKKKKKKRAQERVAMSDMSDQSTVRFPVQNINVGSEEELMPVHRERDINRSTLRPLHPLHAHVPPPHRPHPSRAHLQPIERQPNLSGVRRKIRAPSAPQPLTGLRRGRKENPNIARNVAMLREKKNEPEKKGFLEPILAQQQLKPREELEQDHEIFHDPRVFPVPLHGVIPPELLEEYVEYPIPEELLYSEQLSHEHRFPGMSIQHGFAPREAYIDPRQLAHYQLASLASEMEDPGLVLDDDDELGLDTVLALPPTRQKFWDSDFRS